MNNDKLIKVTVSFDTVALAENENIATNSIINNIEEVIRQEQSDGAVRWEFNDIKTVADLPRGWSSKDIPWSNKKYPDITIKEVFSTYPSMKKVSGYYAVVFFVDTKIVGTVQTEKPYDLYSKWDDGSAKIIENWKPILVE